MRMRRLPPFLPLIAFDAVLRHGSFTRAAAELGVTQSAVSHQLRRLERHFDAPLLRRLNPGVAPTAEGASLAAALGPALDTLAALGGALRRAPAPALRVGVGAALATWWLVRRLPRFAAAHPAVRIELVTLDGAAAPADLDLSILWVPAAGIRASTTQAVLARERVLPVCRPALLRGIVQRGPEALAMLPLIHKGRERAQGPEWNWSTWLARFGLSPARAAGTEALRFADLGMALAAALEGGGVALGRTLLVRDALADRRLVRVLPARFDLAASKVQVVRWPAALIGDSRVRAFAAWLAREARTDAS